METRQKLNTTKGAVILYVGENGEGICDFSELVGNKDLSAFTSPALSEPTPTISFFENLHLVYRKDPTLRDFDINAFQAYFSFDPAKRAELEKELKAFGLTIRVSAVRPQL